MDLNIKVGVLTCVVVSFCARQALSGCSMVGHEYKLGDVWHPRLTDNVSDFCVTCRCVKAADGKLDMNCTSEMCPEGCTGDSGQSECCSICGGAVASEGGSGPASTASSSSGNGALSTSSRGCVVSGHYYNHGDTYSSNYSKAENDRCQQCFCNDRQTTCRTKVCPTISCPTPLYTSRDCCRVCPDEQSSELDWDTMVSFYDPTSTRQRQSRDCHSGGRYFVDGATWHPVIGPFGEMDCVMCKCDNGRIDCSRLKCLSKNEMACKRPIKVTGQCCPTCPVDPTSLPDTDCPDGGACLIHCLDIKMDLKVWKSNGGGQKSEFVQYVFESVNNPSEEVEFHRMMIKNQKLEGIDVMSLTTIKFTELKSKFVFKLLGGTTKRLKEKFVRREDKFKRQCFDAQTQKKCNPHIQKLDKILKIKKYATRHTCARGERQIQI